MEDVLKVLIKEQKRMENLLQKLQKQTEQMPEGHLRISTSHHSSQYFWRQGEEETRGIYIKKHERELARLLAQKDYDETVLKMLSDRKKKLDALIATYQSGEIATVYDSMCDARKALVNPCILPDDLYVKQWENRTYSGKAFQEDAPEIYSEKGERVRSKSEKILADKFYMMNIPYHYECPLQLKGYGTVYPDFMLLNRRTRKEYYYEHLGMMDQPDYCEKAIRKIETYEKNGIYNGEQLLLSYETSRQPLNMKSVERMIERYLM